MFYNGVNCDIYIGKGAGKKLLNDIYSARKSIKIVSPYISPFLISELINIRKRNLEVELITTDNIKDFSGDQEKNTRKLIIQNRETDDISVKKREKWKYLIKVLTYIGLGLLVILIGVTYYLQDIKLVFGLIPIMIIYLIVKLYRKKIKQKQIYSYWYSQLFPFKVYRSPYSTEQSDTFVHSKIYLIDDEIAYLGSLNFTASGTKYNYETRIRTSDFNAVKKIKEEFYQLMYQSQLPEREIQAWGRQLYSEPIN
jgi:phosphatidylserine/phosphatidylglycerophosphate/cardiolipin synthase-like enzyme